MAAAILRVAVPHRGGEAPPAAASPHRRAPTSRGHGRPAGPDTPLQQNPLSQKKETHPRTLTTNPDTPFHENPTPFYFMKYANSRVTLCLKTPPPPGAEKAREEGDHGERGLSLLPPHAAPNLAEVGSHLCVSCARCPGQRRPAVGTGCGCPPAAAAAPRLLQGDTWQSWRCPASAHPPSPPPQPWCCAAQLPFAVSRSATTFSHTCNRAQPPQNRGTCFCAHGSFCGAIIYIILAFD